MDIQKENNLIQEAFEVEADEIGFCLDQKWGDYENPYENSDTALAFNLFKKGWQAAKAQAVPEGFVLMPMVPSERMINAVRQCYEGEAFLPYSLYDAYVKQAMIEAQEPSNNVTPELVNNAVTYVIELQGYEAIEYARATLNKKGYKTWDYTDKDSIDDTDIYVLCVCPSTPNDSALVKGTFKGIHQGKFTYIQSDLESCPDAQEPAND